MNPTGPDFPDLERRLASWRPADLALDRDRLIFEAGRASGRAEVRSGLWRGLTASASVVAVVLGGLLAVEHSRQVSRDVVTHVSLVPPLPVRPQTHSPDERIEPPSPSSYLAMTARLRHGESLLPEPEPRPSPPSIAVPVLEPLRSGDLDRVLDL